MLLLTSVTEFKGFWPAGLKKKKKKLEIGVSVLTVAALSVGTSTILA